MNRQNLFHLLIIFLGLAVFSCSSAQSQSSKKGKQEEKYQEDLSKVRPSYKPSENASDPSKNTQTVVTPVKDDTKLLNAKIDTLSNNNAPKYAQGYRILVYSGKSSAEVKNARTKIYEILPDADIYQDFKSPNQRVKVGNCLDRIEAYNLYGVLKKHFPNAVIIPDQVNVKVK